MAKRKSKKVDGAANITDGCNPELVDGARFDGILEIPIIEKPEKLMVPSGMVPFSKMDRIEDPRRFAVCEYELDVEFADLLRDPDKYVKELRRYQAFVTPDASLYWDMPLAAQIVNKYRNHAVGHYMQSKGIYTIPNVRWGDERTYTCGFLPEPLAFLGVEKHSIVSIGSYGVVKTHDEKRHFRAGLEAMLEWLEPEVVLVYGSTPDDVFGEYWKYSEFVRYPDWTSYQRRDEEQAQPEETLRKPGREG
ncbi:MAG: DUF4417 domain-containing protein [Eggerthellaceae bacterium]|nr:DUF4417 domain-containing protein [Eggerthellaceae bacterium]